MPLQLFRNVAQLNELFMLGDHETAQKLKNNDKLGKASKPF